MFVRLRPSRCCSNGRFPLSRCMRMQHSQISNVRLNSHVKAIASPAVVFSGIQPTGVPHLGNYLGALQQWVKIQDEASPEVKLIYSLVDLHAITLRQSPESLRRWKKESLAMLLAVGLDPERSTIFHQSDVPAHAELMWILSCQASTGYLGRMTQWKDKTANERKGSEKLKLGLFSYPVLQAADVLVHRSTHVPVGHDQAQHLEFARELAIGFNSVYGEDVLAPPETIISPAKRVMSLTNPTAKMSKSDANPMSRILLTDLTDQINHKITKSLTDSMGNATYNPEHRPGVSNLLDIIFYCRTRSDDTDWSDFLKDMESLSMQALKAKAAQSVNDIIAPIRERYEELIQDEKLLQGVTEGGAAKARASAAPTLQKIKEAVGVA